MTQSRIFLFLVSNVANLSFSISFCWKWPASCHVFAKMANR